MNKQQKEVQQVFLDSEKQALKELKANYKDALIEVNAKIELLMARSDADMQNVIYQIEYQKAIRKQVQSALDNLHSNNFETVSQFLTESYENGFIGTMYDLQKQGVPLVIPIDQKQVVEAIQHDTKLSESLYESLGKNISTLKKQVSGEISRGISSGMMTSEIARNISGYADISINNSMRIARTESHRIQCKSALDAQYKAKEQGADVVKQWDSFLDGNTRDSHRKLNGQIRELDEDFEVDGMTAAAPGMFGDPAEDCNCRCALLQRARWALGNDYTKWSEDAEIEINEDGSASQLIDMSDAKTFKEFKGYYKDATGQMTMNFAVENSGKSGIIYVENKITSYMEKPDTLGNTTPKEKYDSFIEHGVNVKPLNKGSLKGISYEDGGGYKVNGTQDGKYLQYHPEDKSHHNGAYYKLSSGKTGTKRYDLDGNLIED